MIKYAIHQPYFAPWLGYFHKISLVDKFIIFDHVQMPNMKYYLSRVQILFNNSPYWLSVPIIRKFNQNICDVLINNSENWKRKHLGTLKQAYQKSPFFDEVFSFISTLYSQDYDIISDLDMSLIQGLSNKLGFETEFVRSSSIIKSHKLFATDAIIEVCQKFNVRHYVAGKGPSLEFLDFESFEKNNIYVEFQNFIHPIYAEITRPVGLSILDPLFLLGFEATSKLIKEIK